MEKSCPDCDRQHVRGSPSCPHFWLDQVFVHRYRVERLIGSGGMGRVYAGLDQRTGRTVALKLLLATSRPSMLERLENERLILAKLSDIPGIVQIFDQGMAPGGAPFLVMELLQGAPFRALFLRRSTSIRRIVALVAEVADILEAAHQKGVFHRDLKPDNLFLVQHGYLEQVRVLDFGISKALFDDNPELTDTGDFLGTITYVSPEQIEDFKRVDARADIYSLGAVLFVMLTGQRPVLGENTSSQMSRLLRNDIRRHPAAFRAHVPEWLDTLVAKCMAFDRAHRPSSARALAQALRAGLISMPEDTADTADSDDPHILHDPVSADSVGGRPGRGLQIVDLRQPLSVSEAISEELILSADFSHDPHSFSLHEDGLPSHTERRMPQLSMDDATSQVVIQSDEVTLAVLQRWRRIELAGAQDSTAGDTTEVQKTVPSLSSLLGAEWKNALAEEIPAPSFRGPCQGAIVTHVAIAGDLSVPSRTWEGLQQAGHLEPWPMRPALEETLPEPPPAARVVPPDPPPPHPQVVQVEWHDAALPPLRAPAPPGTRENIPTAFPATPPPATSPPAASARATSPPAETPGAIKAARPAPRLSVTAVLLVGLVVGAGVMLGRYSSPEHTNTGKQDAAASALKLRHPSAEPSFPASLSASPGTASERRPLERVLFPAGSIHMGSSAEEVEAALHWCQTLTDDCNRDLYNRELPSRQVTLSAFALDRFEVSAGQVADWLRTRPGTTLEPARILDASGAPLLFLEPGDALQVRGESLEVVPERAQLPMTAIPWTTARAYCLEHGADLPTEAQWERAARGLERRTFPWGENKPTCATAALWRQAQGRCQSMDQGPAPVGSIPGDITPEGIHDMAGNVSEFVLDSFVAPYPSCSGLCLDPISTAGDFRVARGGNFALPFESARGSGRIQLDADWSPANVGFRCAESGVR